MQKTLKIAITGGSGFVGQHLLEDIGHSNYTLRIITRNASKKIDYIPSGSEIFEADLTNYKSLLKAFEGMDVIVNIAAEVRDQKNLTETNISGTKNLIKAAIENKVSKIIHLSSVGVVGMQYSNSSITVDEKTECNPKNEYERTKLESEKLLIEVSEKYNFQLTILRPTNIFGERHPFNTLLHLMKHINSQKTTISTNLATVNYLYVKDLTKLILKLIEDQKGYGIVNVGDSMNLNSFVKNIASELGKKANIVSSPPILINFIEILGIKKLRAVSNGVNYTDEKLKTFFQYPYGLQNGLKRTIAYYKKQKLLP